MVFQDAATFFEILCLPAPTLHPDILTLHDPADATDPRVYQLLCTMYLAMFPAHTEESESAVHDFAFLLFQDLGYAPIGRVFRTKKDINMVVCGEQRRVTADVCVLNDQRDILLLVQEDKGRGDPVPHLVAAAIAAFYSNNLIRRQTFGLPALASKTIPGITMKGTSPIFFKIPVTLELVAAVMGGQYPGTPTLIFPSISRPAERLSEGMKPWITEPPPYPAMKRLGGLSTKIILHPMKS